MQDLQYTVIFKFGIPKEENLSHNYTCFLKFRKLNIKKSKESQMYFKEEKMTQESKIILHLILLNSKKGLIKMVGYKRIFLDGLEKTWNEEQIYHSGVQTLR